MPKTKARTDAAKYRLLPPLDPGTYTWLKANIAINGVQVPVAPSDILWIDRLDQRSILGRRNQSFASATQRLPDLLDSFPHPEARLNQLLDASGIEGRVVDLVFARMERPRLAEGVGEQVGLLVQILAVST